ncbi:MAG: WD40/YVTN/BNR-like repeat-containing protein, partial [Planctomycetota bacterium]
MMKRTIPAGVGALLLCGCSQTTTSLPAHAAAPGTQYSNQERTEAALYAIRQKQQKLRTQGPRSFDQPAEAHDFFVQQRLSTWQPVYPWSHQRRTLDEILVREQAGTSSAATSAGWTWLGPGNRGGRTRAFVIDPNDPDIMYAGGVAGGIWKSTDAGASWSVADDLLINLAVTSIAMEPNDTSVLYAGTGEGVLSGRPGVRGLGIFKSVDAGASWTQLEGTVDVVPNSAFHYVNEVVISPHDSDRIYAATRTGVWRSLDAGQNWSVILSNPQYIATPPTTNGCPIGCTDLAIRTDMTPDVIFAAFGSFQRDGLYRSDDGGETWHEYPTGVEQGRMTVAFAPGDNDIIYLLMANNGATGQTGQLVDVFRSDDGGQSFTGRVDMDSLTGPWLLSNLILATGCLEGGTYSQGWYDNIIAVDPIDPDIVWVGGVDIFRSDDGGRNWGIPGYWIFYQLDPPPPYYIHPDHHNIVFHPQYNGTTNQTMYVTNDGGLFRTTNARAAT